MEREGFFQALFDFSFTSFITSKLIKILYGLAILGAILGALMLIMSGFSQSTGVGLFMLFIGAPLFFLFWVIYARVLLELIIVIFRIAEHAAEIATLLREKSA